MLPNTVRAIKKLKVAGYLIIIISNQAVVARGWINELELSQINANIFRQLKKRGAKIDGIFYCPHHPNADLKRYRKLCNDRKPNIGLIKKAVKQFKINLNDSYFIGDTTVDVETARRAGIKSILVKTGYGGKDKKYKCKPDIIAKDLYDAAKKIQKNDDSPQALILSAGKGTRLYPLAKSIPKVMINIKNKPLLEHHVRLLKKWHITEISINLYTAHDVIKAYFNNGKAFGVNIHYLPEYTNKSYKGPKLLGSAGALHNLKNRIRENLLIIYGDVYMNVDLKKMINYHNSKKSLFTIAVHKASHPQDSDLVEFNKNSRVTKLIKTPHHKIGGFNNAGLYIMNKVVLNYLPKKIPLDFAHDFIPLLMKKIPLFVYDTSELMMDIGTTDRYNKLLELLKNE